MASSTQALNIATGLVASEVIAAGETPSVPSGKRIVYVIPMGGNAALSALTDGPQGMASDVVLTQDVPYPLQCSSLTLDAGSTGDLWVFFA